jgi:hypothetical protein
MNTFGSPVPYRSTTRTGSFDRSRASALRDDVSSPNACSANARPFVPCVVDLVLFLRGYDVNRPQVLGDDAGYKDKVRACCGFDSIYRVKDKDADFWADWAERHAGAQGTMFYLVTDKAVGKNPKRPSAPTTRRTTGN